MIDQRQFEDATRELERAQRDYSRAKNTIESTKKQLAEFVLLNSELISQGGVAIVALAAWEEQINEAEFEVSSALTAFEENKKRLTQLISRISLY
jgi:exonuclease VII small subunit